MKRKKTVVYYPGPTINYLTQQQLCSLRNGQFVPNRETGCVYTDLFGQTDRYKEPYKSKKFFYLEESFECFPLRLTPTKDTLNIDIWFFYEWKIYIEYFDVNVLIDVRYPVGETEKERDWVINRLVRELRKRYDVEICGDNDIINVKRLSV